MNYRLLMTLVLSCFALSACAAFGSVSGEVISHMRSPNGLVDAVITKSTDGGATVSTVFRVYLITTSNSASYQILKVERPSMGVVTTWKDDHHLAIDMPCGQIFSYTNFLDLMSKGNLVYQVSINLKNTGLCSTYVSSPT